MTRARRSHPDAVVVGLCPHGLAVARALRRQGIAVLGLEADDKLAGCMTNAAEVCVRGPINGAGLPRTLEQLAQERAWSAKPVLFLTNDKMVREVASNVPVLTKYYRWSWENCCDRILQLLNKERLPDICKGRTFRVPETIRIADIEEAGRAAADLVFPAIVKPSWPLGTFKVRIAERPRDVVDLAENHSKSLPFVVQRLIQGDVRKLRFGVLYLRNGEVVARFEGRKAYAGADGLGQATVMEPYLDDQVFRAAVDCVDGLGLSGPVAVEFKLDEHGDLWLIEPNVGRTEYCVDVCARNGLNLPWIEYQHVTRALPSVDAAARTTRRIWFDTDRDPLAWVRYAAGHPTDLRVFRPLFPFMSVRDPLPFLGSLWRKLKRRTRRRA